MQSYRLSRMPAFGASRLLGPVVVKARSPNPRRPLAVTAKGGFETMPGFTLFYEMIPTRIVNLMRLDQPRRRLTRLGTIETASRGCHKH
jgi:hypothetical protein